MSTRTTDRTDVLLLIDAVIDEDLEFLQEAVW